MREDTCLDMRDVLHAYLWKLLASPPPLIFLQVYIKPDPPAHVTIDAEIRRRSSLLILENGERKQERKNCELRSCATRKSIAALSKKKNRDGYSTFLSSFRDPSF